MQYGIKTNICGHLANTFTVKMGNFQVVDGNKKLNNQNYNPWSTCMMPHMQGQHLLQAIHENEVRQPEAEDMNGTL